MDILEQMASKEDTELNILYRSYNPTMTICLACEVLGMISDAKGVFE